jgi:N-acetylmuramoyl-L-alanine amidase
VHKLGSARLVAGVVLAALLVLSGVGDAATSGAPQPAITNWKIPFPAKRKQEMKAYAQRHYGISSYKLTTPHVIVEHVAAAGSAQAVYNTFAPDNPDPELHELPNVCAHFVVGADGTIYRLVNTSLMCRHTVGLNYTAIGIEHVGFADSDVLNDKAQMRASLALTNWLRCTHGIKIKNVIGHNESLSSPYHRENVAALRNQTHGDMKQASMKRYRKRLRKRSC